uniref:hypothetical protein n=1 Tax=Paractinoplanes polyasparticus TaxID=2856853 RepID=UPI001C862ADD|nr:hypothetical protein [Actinoplanes polyasparticus]
MSAADTTPQDADNRRRLADAVRTRRLELGLSVRAAAAQTRVARDTWIGLEEATRRTAETNYAGIEDTLQWARGAIRIILDGGEPVTASPAESAPKRGTFISHDSADTTLIRIMNDPSLTDAQKAKIVRAVIIEQQRVGEQYADELIAQARAEQQ